MGEIKDPNSNKDFHSSQIESSVSPSLCPDLVSQVFLVVSRLCRNVLCLFVLLISRDTFIVGYGSNIQKP